MEQNIYFTSDLHAYHTNLCYGTSKWANKEACCRRFKTIEEMNSEIIKSINRVVKEDDILYHLGDWSFGGIENVWNLRKQIVCKNIIQINGNHDYSIKNNKALPNLIKVQGIIIETDNKFNLSEDSEIVTTRDLFTEVYDTRIIRTINGQQIIMDHYPYEHWENEEHGTWMLFGHMHHDLDGSITSMKYKRMDVGWDGKVYSFDEIKQIMDKRENNVRH